MRIYMPLGLPRRLRVCMATLLLLSGAIPMSAQVFRGKVLDDSTKLPLDNVAITLLNQQGAELAQSPVRTDSSGVYTLSAREEGVYRVRATRIGYQPVTSEAVRVASGERASINLSMSSTAQRVGTVVVSDRRSLSREELMSPIGFELRRSAGVGKFLDTLELAEYGRRSLGWVLTDDRARFGIRQDMTMFGRDGTCVPEIWMDGWTASRASVEGLGAHQLYGIEVYDDINLPPPSIGGPIGRTSAAARGRCGAIVIWTRRFAER